MNLPAYVSKMKGGASPPPRVTWGEIFWSWAGSFLGIGACALLSSRYFEPRDLTLIIGSFGASCALIYGVVRSPFSQPRNVLGGHVLSALVGVASYKLFGGNAWLAISLGVSFAVGLMFVTKTFHPPGGATALIAVTGGKSVHDLGFLYALIPAGLGAAILLVVALLFNNLSKYRRYPEYWF